MKKLLILIFILIINSYGYGANLWFTMPTVSSTIYLDSSGQRDVRYYLRAANGYTCDKFWTRLTYPDGSDSGWVEGYQGEWTLIKTGVYTMEGKAHVLYNYLGQTDFYIYTASNLTFTIADSIAPSIPQNLSVTESSNEHPSLSWDANTESDLKEYNVYRKGGYPFVDWTIIATPDSNSYDDDEVTTTYSHGEDFFYKITAVDNNDNESDYSNTVEIEARLEKQMIDEDIVEETPKVYALNSNYPNPFNPTTQISYQIPNDGFVNLDVYNSIGQIVAKLVDEHQSGGKYSIQFNAANLPNGVYYYKLQANSFTSVKKMLLLK